MENNILILHNPITSGSPDEIDVLEQVNLVKSALLKNNFNVITRELSNHIWNDIQHISSRDISAVFNLVEATWGKSELLYVVPSLLHSCRIPYTGNSYQALFITTNKVLTKKIMTLHGILTPEYYLPEDAHQIKSNKTYLIKPIDEDASVGILPENIFTAEEKNKIKKIKQLDRNKYFIEEYIDGREFNVSMFGARNNAEVLPPAELVFSDYYKDKPKIVDYRAKWDEESPEYHESYRAFDTLKNTPQLEQKIIEVCQKLWLIFELNGYARIDMRIDNNGKIYILEINANPCISPDSGFIAAVKHAGYNVADVIRIITMEVNR